MIKPSRSQLDNFCCYRFHPICFVVKHKFRKRHTLIENPRPSFVFGTFTVLSDKSTVESFCDAKTATTSVLVEYICTLSWSKDLSGIHCSGVRILLLYPWLGSSELVLHGQACFVAYLATTPFHYESRILGEYSGNKLPQWNHRIYHIHRAIRLLHGNVVYRNFTRFLDQ